MEFVCVKVCKKVSLISAHERGVWAYQFLGPEDVHASTSSLACTSAKLTDYGSKVHVRLSGAPPFSTRVEFFFNAQRLARCEPRISSSESTHCIDPGLVQSIQEWITSTVQFTQCNHSTHPSPSAWLGQQSGLQRHSSALNHRRTWASYPNILKSLITNPANGLQGLFWRFLKKIWFIFRERKK